MGSNEKRKKKLAKNLFTLRVVVDGAGGGGEVGGWWGGGQPGG